MARAGRSELADLPARVTGDTAASDEVPSARFLTRFLRA
jgi:hypothetical protein